MMLEISFIFYQAVIALRIVTEMNHLTRYIFIHQLFWFNSVLIIFFLIFRYMLKIEKKRLWILFTGSFLTFIPLIYAKIMGAQWALNYIQPVSVSQVVFDILTLLLSHDYNWPMFPELAALLLGATVIGWLLTKKLLKSFLFSLSSVYGSFLILGFSWVSVNPDHPTMFPLKSGFYDHQFYSFQLISYFSFFAVIAFGHELFNFFKHLKRPFLIFVFFIIVSAFAQFSYLYFFRQTVTVPDIFVTFLPAGSIILTLFIISFSKFKAKILRGAFLPFWIALFSVIVSIKTGR